MGTFTDYVPALSKRNWYVSHTDFPRYFWFAVVVWWGLSVSLENDASSISRCVAAEFVRWMWTLRGMTHDETSNFYHAIRQCLPDVRAKGGT
jgi:hypothetical protein